MSKAQDYVPLLIKIAIAVTVVVTVSVTFAYYYTENIKIEVPVPIDNQTKPPIVNDTKPPVVNDTIPIPFPKPVVNQSEKNVIMVGDIYGDIGKQVAQSIKDKDPELVIVLGDLGYGNDADYFNEVYGDLKGKLACVIGNHDDGIALLEEYCGDPYYIKLNTVLFLGLNTEGDFTNQGNQAVSIVKSENVTSVHVMTHFPWKAPPNSQHPEDEDSQSKSASTMIQKVLDAVPSGVKKFSDNAHNHGLAEGKVGDVTVLQSGGGGREKYECDTSVTFPFCEPMYGFLEYVIKSNGDTTWSFYNENGVKIR